MIYGKHKMSFKVIWLTLQNALYLKMMEATQMVTNINKQEITYKLSNSVIYRVTCMKSIMHVIILITKTDIKQKEQTHGQATMSTDNW